jgi:hypothetical protein
MFILTFLSIQSSICSQTAGPMCVMCKPDPHTHTQMEGYKFSECK